mmetsp:Transcript_71017/g.160730  ORF Transcript_71017/g.160730 Transcript_71017/m.160730 type:complete len:93 (-) Transcript_71017:384-662(-)
MARLRSGWLHDEVINAFHFLLQEREMRLRQQILNWPTSHFANFFFFPRMAEGGNHTSPLRGGAGKSGHPRARFSTSSHWSCRRISGDRTELR